MSKNHNYPRVIAAFDFDNTLIDRDSLLPFLFYTAGWKTTVSRLFQLLPDFIKYLIRMKTRQQVKEDILTKFFQGKDITRLKQKGDAYAHLKLDQFIQSEALQRLRWHQQQGHECCIISASVDLYLEPWAIRHGITRVISSQLIIEEGKVTGKLQGLNCWGPEKVRRLIAELGPKETFQLYAYGDSRGDQELLNLADFPYYRKFT